MRMRIGIRDLILAMLMAGVMRRLAGFIVSVSGAGKWMESMGTALSFQAPERASDYCYISRRCLAIPWYGMFALPCSQIGINL